jgi:hypothetical protein
MKPIIATIKGGVIRYITPITTLKSGGYKRQIFVDYGNQKYIIDELVDDIQMFLTLDLSTAHDFLVYVNGLETKNGRYDTLALYQVRPSDMSYA